MRGSFFRFLIVAAICWILAYVYYENYLLKQRGANLLVNKNEHINRSNAVSPENGHVTNSRVIMPVSTTNDRAESTKRSIDEFRTIHRKQRRTRHVASI